MKSWAFDKFYKHTYNPCSNTFVYNAGALQMYVLDLSQYSSAQCPSRQIDTQSWYPYASSGSPLYQFTKLSERLSEVQMNVPSEAKSVPPIQSVQQFHQSGEHKPDKDKNAK